MGWVLMSERELRRIELLSRVVEAWTQSCFSLGVVEWGSIGAMDWSVTGVRLRKSPAS